MDPDRNPDDLNQIEVNNQIGKYNKRAPGRQVNAPQMIKNPSKKSMRGYHADRVQY